MPTTFSGLSISELVGLRSGLMTQTSKEDILGDGNFFKNFSKIAPRRFFFIENPDELYDGPLTTLSLIWENVCKTSPTVFLLQQSLLFDQYSPIQIKITPGMKPNKPWMITSTRSHITIGWDNCDLVVSDGNIRQQQEKKSWWYVLEKKDRIRGWYVVYMGFKTQADVGPLAPSDYYEFRLKVTNGEEDSKWSDTLFAVTKDDVVPVAHLHRVVENGPVTTLRRVLGQRPSIVDIPNRFQQTPLRVAIRKNNTTFMGIILNHGADIENPEPGSERTPLMTAAQLGHLEVAQFLLEKGSSWETTDRSGLTALNYAVDNSHVQVVELAVENGANLSIRDKFGWTPLMRAVTLKSSLQVLTYLLDNGSDPNESDEREQTVMMQAVLSGRPEVVELLLAKGADIERKNIYGHSAYDMARCSTNEGILKIAHLLSNEPEEDLKRSKFKKRVK